jgi:uncharacterized zinc-type alcohol dehydrogenase-like protein
MTATRTPAPEVSDSIIDGYAAASAGGTLSAHRYRAAPLRPHDVEIAVTHCGICHSDLHLLDNDWGMTAFPFVPGHEIVGEITRVGSEVPPLRIGQRVGVGFLAGADFSCDECAKGRDNLCENWEPTCLGRPGGFAERVVADARLSFPIPDAIASEHAAPLMCAGVTVFAPLLRHADASTRLGVIGIGGLGHLALQYGRAFGCHVTAFTTSADKEEEARAFGAHDVVNVSAPGAIAAHANSCDLLLCTATADVPWNEYVGVLRRNGKLCLLGIPGRELSLSPIPLIFFQRSVVTSGIGSRWEMREMLAFSAQHGIVPQVEVFPMREVNTALARLRRNDVRYRAVLATA